jgi:hypothetical protein
MIFPSQKEWANNIYDKFANGETDYCLFVAQMQSGKTGTYLYLARKMLRAGFVSKIVIFSGNRERELRIQTEKRVKQDENIRDFTQVVWGASLNKFSPSDEPTLYIWDESHYGQTKGQAVYDFLIKCNLTPTPECSRNDGNFFLSVSATPFSELHNIDPKQVVWMGENPKYWGVREMLQEQQILPYETSIEEIISILKTYDTGYSLIRIYKEYYAKMITSGVASPCDPIMYDLNHKGDIDKILQKKPKHHTLIFLKGKLQMGKTIKNQKYINLCIETTLTKKTDSLLQGFIGRFCGYDTNHNTKIYIPSKIHGNGELQKYVSLFEPSYEGEEKTIPCKGMNLLMKKPTTEKEVFHNEPSLIKS